MEFDSQSQCSDEVAEFSISEHGELYPGDFPYTDDNESLEAKIVYILMPKNVPISRAARLQWLLDHLNTTITIPSHKLNECSNDLQIICALPREQNLLKCNHFLITWRTEVKFVAQNYRFVYCLDMSPSHANVDIQKGEVLFNEILNCFKYSLEGLSKQFTIPGNPFIFQPCIYLTIMVNTPFFISPAQQVILKGIQMTSDNLNEIIKCVENHFYLLESRVAEVAEMALDQIEPQRAEHERNLEDIPEIGKTVPVVTPDANFVNMLRYSMLAISLLPEISLSHILVITDGIVAMPDSNIMESLLFQLHYDAIAVSFLKVGSTFHPHAPAGFVSYTDLLYFFAHSTLGTCLESFIHIEDDPTMSMNIYHEIFLLWSFHSGNKYANMKTCDNSSWTALNESFYSHRLPTLLSKRQTDENTTASILLLLARRMREGFTVDNIYYMNGNLEIKLILQWKSSIYIHYRVSSEWPVPKNQTHFEVYVSAPYEFLHDMTCWIKKETKSLYRQAIIDRFWIRLSQLSSGDLGLAHQLSSFQFNKDWYLLPESVKNGLSVFNNFNNGTCSDTMKLVLTPRDVSCLKFVNIWQPIAQLETNNWRKWFHTHKISLILKHDDNPDNPVPKHLHIASSSQRYQVVQCRQAVKALYGMLGNWASFILIDNHTYLKLLYTEQEKPPSWFCIVRVSLKYLCAVLNVGFSTHTPGYLRHEICDELKIELSNLSYLSSPVKSKDNLCCIVLHKPLEKFLIRYERIPSNYTTVIFPDGTQPPHSTLNLPAPFTGSLFTTLSRYLFHKRWIWSATHYPNLRLPDQAVSRILNTLTRMRIREGYSFAHSSSGIITMVLELPMDPQVTCVVQYVLFPPHFARFNDDTYSGSDEENEQGSEGEAEMQMVTEVWIEPQYGKVISRNPRIAYMDNKYYYEIADVISRVDMQCINVLLTMEHLSLMCQDKSNVNNISNTMLPSSSRRNFAHKICKNAEPQNVPDSGSPWYPIVTPRIEHIPFKFDPISILPLCLQTELLFSMFIEPKEKSLVPESKADKANRVLLDNILEHLGLLHDHELDLNKDDFHRFTEHILLRHRNTYPHICPLSPFPSKVSNSQWRCFVKGVSVTHVILTFIPATLDDLKSLVISDAINLLSSNESTDSAERTSSRGSNFSDVPMNTSNSICLPVYVFDCPLAILVNSYVNHFQEVPNYSDDIYEDHKFTSFLQEECIKLKSDDERSCDNKDELKPPDTSSVIHHCKTLVLAHSKCFTLSLFIALHMGLYVHSSDVQAAMDQCDEEPYDVDITEYLMNICAHMKQVKEEKIQIQQLHQACPCSELKSLHMLIKKKFFKMVGTSFNPIPTNSEFYFYKNLTNYKSEEEIHDSDDETSVTQSDVVEFRSDKDFSIYSEGPHLLQRLESGVSNISDFLKVSEVSPLFLHLMCTLKYNNSCVTNNSMRVLPTCLGELIQNLEESLDTLDKSKLQITLDILCLTLPPGVQNVITDYSNQGLRTTSFCSDVFQPSIGSFSEASFISDIPEPQKNLPDFQMKSIMSLREEIRWLLQDEICTSLLDSDPVDESTLYYVMQHVLNGNPERPSCLLERIDLNFVYTSVQSHTKFVEEFTKMQLPTSFKMCKEADLYYLAKDVIKLQNGTTDNDTLTNPSTSTLENTSEQNLSNVQTNNNTDFSVAIYDLFDDRTEQVDVPKNNSDGFKENDSQQSEISSTNESVLDTDGGYDEDVSEDEEDYYWLTNLDNKRPHLPNFWLIMKVDQDMVTVYFHCRFLDLPTTYVHIYLDVQRAVCEAIRELCKKVNQLLLLQSLYETKICDSLLEPDDNWHIDKASVSRNTSYTRLKNLDVEVSDDSDVMAYSSLSEASLNFKPGYFTCPAVWETHFILHPRLKTGPGKSGISRGILALKNILDKFSVLNRNNMFVYRDNEANVFYLRLHENVYYVNNKSTQLKPNDYDSTTVSRSPSITSLPLGQSKVNNLAQSEQSIISVISNDLIRPRVRSFGEKEIKDYPGEDTLILRVHGITDAGPDVQCDLVQVLQNRLDDAVLDFLSVMLARNAMCPLTPEDVQFIQRPFKQPECIIRLTIQDFALQWLHSFTHYLKQNLLQFLNVPKYTDSRTLSHFKDYSENDDTHKLAGDDHIFIYNQSQNPSSGNRGIACIALAIISNPEKIPKIDIDERFFQVFKDKDYELSVASQIIDDKETRPDSYLEFRIWKQGRVNIEALSKKLNTAVSQAAWDIVTEFFLLKKPLCVENYDDGVFTSREVIDIDKIDTDLSKEIEFNCILDLNVDKNVKESVSNSSKRKIDAHLFPRKFNRIQPSSKAARAITFDCDDGVLSEIYSKYLPTWFDFGYIYLSTPSIKPQKINLTNRHLPHIVVKELVAMLTDDTPKSFRAVSTHCLVSKSDDMYVPFVSSSLIQKYVIISRNTQFNNSNVDGSIDMSDIGSSSNLKHTQKFLPAVCNNVFIPRQKMFWLSIENDSILIYTYNWAKDSIDKLIANCSNLGQWLCVRSCFLNSVISQKLGLFHNQPLTRKCFTIATNNYSSLIGNLECMSSFPKDHLHKRANQSTFNLLAVLEAFRDSFRNTRYTSNDPVVIFTIEMKEMKSLEKKFREEMKKLHSMYQSRTSTTTVPQINLLMQNSRILHYCHTPLLFLPRWRLKSAATRDHSLHPSQAIQIADKFLSDGEEGWHTDLCYDFFTEYRYYLQTLGFIPLIIDSPHAGIGVWEKDKSSYNSVFYIQKTILGGILIFTVEFSEPFFVTKLHAIECNRLQIISSRASVNRFTLCFLDECDRVKILMHLHSFTYDFHLRSIYNYVSGSHTTNKLCDRYNVHQFLDDFLKYYTKAPNFARNLVHTETITITDLVTEGRQLFEYLLSNVSQYSFKVLEMDSYDNEKEFILVRVTSTSQVSYKDAQDRHHTDDFDITLVVYNLCLPYSPSDNVLHLKYYLILTSKEQHPKTEIEQKLGKFRMVSQGNKSLSREISREFEPRSLKNEQKLELQNSDEHGSSSSFSKSGEHSDHDSQGTSMPHIAINVEPVNYLGYYSSHEQVMQQIILDKAHTTQKSIREMVAKGMVHCRTNLLWNRLITPQDSNNLTFEEFIELKNLAKLKHLCQLHPDIGSLLNQPLSWYQGLSKQLLAKYADQNRTFFSSDGNIQYYVILNPRYFGAFMMLSIDLHTSRGELYAVYREPHKQEDGKLCLAYQKSLLDGFVNCICFYLWSGMIST